MCGSFIDRIKFEEIENKIINCNKCSRLISVTPYPMSHVCYAKSINNIKIALFARNPGLENDSSKILSKDFLNFVHDKWKDCRIGKYFRKHLGDDIIFNYVFFSNICKCSSPFNSKLKQEEIDNCLNFSLKQILEIKPEILLTFGQECLSALNPLLNLYMCFGKVYEYKINNFKCAHIPLYHPSYFIYKINKEKEYKQINILQVIKKRYSKNF